MRTACVVGVLAAVAAAPARPARADVTMTLEQLWPALPLHAEPSMSDQVADWMTSVGVDIDHHLGALSHDVVDLRIDGRNQRTHLGIHFLSFAMDEDVHVADGIARMHTRLQLRVGEHALAVQLPDVEMQQDGYRGERITELRVPLLERRW